jgi:hypothetical protein
LEASLDGVQTFGWMKMYQVPAWDCVEKSIDFVLNRLGDRFKNIFNQDVLFDEFNLTLEFVNDNRSNWIEKKSSAEQIWKEFALCLPGTSVEVERIFSLINQIWTDQKGSIEINTIDSLITLQYNNNESCSDFYNKIKLNTNLLKKVHSNEKYD